MKKKGYTLIELIVVLGILSCLAAVAFPNIWSLQSYELNKRLEDTTNGVIGFLNYCKAYSRGKDKESSVIINSNSIELRNMGELIKSYTVPKGVIISSGTLWSKNVQMVKILYVMGGRLESYTLNIINSKGKRNKITIKVATWYVSRSV